MFMRMESHYERAYACGGGATHSVAKKHCGCGGIARHADSGDGIMPKKKIKKRKIKSRRITALIVEAGNEKWRISVDTYTAADVICQMVESLTGYNASFFKEETITYV
jgi:hypothetical protein